MTFGLRFSVAIGALSEHILKTGKSLSLPTLHLACFRQRQEATGSCRSKQSWLSFEWDTLILGSTWHNKVTLLPEIMGVTTVR